MKKIIISVISLIIVISFLSCEFKGTAPVITDVLITDIFGNPTNLASIGETLYVYIYASDEDTDMTLLNGKFYREGFFQYQLDLELPSVSVVNTGFMIYVNIIGPTGNWRVDLQITDSKANKSNVYNIYFSVI